jgi:hypothetical protein
MKVELRENWCIVTREDGDKKFYNTGWASAESVFLYHVKKKLIEMGHDVIKKRMWKDGHMMDQEQQYIVTRKGYEPSFYIWNSSYALFDAGQKFNERGEMMLAMIRDIWKGGNKCTNC